MVLDVVAGKVAAGYVRSGGNRGRRPGVTRACAPRTRPRRGLSLATPRPPVGCRNIWLLGALALALVQATPARASRPAAAGVRGGTPHAVRPTRPRRPTAPSHRRKPGRALAERALRAARAQGLEGDAAVDVAVEHLMDDARRRGIDVSLSIGALRGQRRNIASRFAFVTFDPAHNTRLVTAAHALDQLGPEHRFTTPFRTDRRGNLYVAGAFDPTLDDAALRDAARAIRDAGVTELRGDLVIDLPLAGGDPADFVLAPGVGGGVVAPRVGRALADAGVGGPGGVGRGCAPRGAVTRFTHTSPTLADITATALASPRAAEMLSLAAAARRRGAPVSPADGAADLAGFLNGRVRLRRFEREYQLTDASGATGANQLSSDHVLAVLRYAARHERTRPLIDALGAGLRSDDGAVRAHRGKSGPTQVVSGVVDGKGGADGVAFSALARGKDAASTAAWLGALSHTLARLEPKKSARPAAPDPSSWPALPDGRFELETTFGRPGEHVVRTRLRLGPGGRMQTVRLNRRIIPLLEVALADAQAQGLLEHIKAFGGAYKLRAKRRPDGTELVPRQFSTHSYGVSFDLNPDVTGGDVDPALGAHFERYGFVWGKYFAHNYDPMHFQFVKGY